ncbi:MAG TPA: hypothetical protein VNT99_08375 [Methylomirabilota bacterium]|nr:hypothetical protein [Methylomirabilota bacterium]
MSQAQPMDLRTARSRADQVCAWLAPYCENILTVGSIRREQPMCGDIDVVCVPKYEKRRALGEMFDAHTEHANLLREFLIQYVSLNTDPVRPKWLGKKGAPGPEPKPDAQNLLLVTSKGVQLDARTLCRTGSVQHNVWACQRAEELKGHWNPYEGLMLHGEPVPLKFEADFYTALQLPYVRPQDREMEFLRTIWQPYETA